MTKIKDDLVMLLGIAIMLIIIIPLATLITSPFNGLTLDRFIQNFSQLIAPLLILALGIEFVRRFMK